MKIVNDTEIYEPSECYFCVEVDGDNPTGTMTCITGIEYWN